MTQNDIRRKALRKAEPLYRQQAPYLQRMGRTRASKVEDDDTADKLRDLDLLAWDETERYLSRFAEDLEDAPYTVPSLLAETASLGRLIGMEVELPPLIAAFTFVRILAGGDEVFKKHQPIWIAIMRSQANDSQAKPLFEKFCQEIEANKLDIATGKETRYLRGDPMERVKDTEKTKTEARIEALLGQILDATEGWNTKDAFEDYWNQWKELWLYLLKQEEMVEKIAQKCPNSKANHTEINIKFVFNVAGLLKKHLEKPLICKDFTDTGLANLTKKAWSSVSSHKEIGFPSELIKKQIDLINDWLAMNIK